MLLVDNLWSLSPAAVDTERVNENLLSLLWPTGAVLGLVTEGDDEDIEDMDEKEESNDDGDEVES